MKKLFVLLSFLILVGCEPPQADVLNALQNEDFTEIDLQGYGGVCGRDYNSSEAFTATNAHGHRVSGTVCCGFWNGCSIHW